MSTTFSPSQFRRSRSRRRPISQVAVGKITVSTTRPTPVRVALPPFPLCPSCDRAISPNGQCGC